MMHKGFLVPEEFGSVVQVAKPVMSPCSSLGAEDLCEVVLVVNQKSG